MNNISLINLSNMQGFRNPLADDKLFYHKKFEIIKYKENDLNFLT